MEVGTRLQGDDVIFLPSIVEAAVASPAAAAECARLIRKFMAREYWSKASCQYNAIMLLRILADNPGPGFTRFLDKKFVDTTKELLRSGRDGSVRQILMETLDAFENTKSQDEGLAMIIEMWKKEKEKAYKAYGVSVETLLSKAIATADANATEGDTCCTGSPNEGPPFQPLSTTPTWSFLSPAAESQQASTRPRRASEPPGRSPDVSQAPGASRGLHTAF
jgi:hypothetical protein